MVNVRLSLTLTLYLLLLVIIYTSQLLSVNYAKADEVIGTQTTMQTPLGKIIQCAGNLLIPPTICTGTNMNDTIVTSPRSGTIFALGGDDKVQGLLGTEVTFGNDGNDAIQGGNSSAVVFGNDGNDVVVGEAGPNILFGTGGSMLFGGPGNDQIIGGIDHDVMSGGPGQDTFLCNGKQDVIVDFEELEDKMTGDCVRL
jgi:Ca2+-binding RTX toxin-like protein